MSLPACLPARGQAVASTSGRSSAPILRTRDLERRAAFGAHFSRQQIDVACSASSAKKMQCGASTGAGRVPPSRALSIQPSDFGRFEYMGSSSMSSNMSPPLSTLDVDAELWGVLDLCSDDELESVYNILHSSSPFSPVVKSLVIEREPALLEQRGRLSVMHKVESRFRFLAADHSKMISGKRPGYRETLLAIRDKIDVHCSSNLGTHDLETEIFLHVLQNCVEYVQGEHDPDPREAAAVAMQAVTEADGMSALTQMRKPNWTERLTAPIRFGFKELVPTMAKFGSAVAVTAAGNSVARTLGTQLLQSHIQYQAALKAVSGVARSAVSTWGKKAMLEAAQKGVTTATARYSALQGAMSLLGPVMWGWLAMDLALKAIGTDYARVIRAVFLLAQVRLVRTQGFVNPTKGEAPSSPSVQAKYWDITDDADDHSDPGGAYGI